MDHLVRPDNASHATLLLVLFGLLISGLLAVLAWVGAWGVVRIERSLGKLWSRLDVLADALHLQGESLAKLWGAHEARSNGSCDPTRWVGPERRQITVEQSSDEREA